MMNLKRFIYFLFCLVCLAPVIFAETYTVPDDYTTIQAALDGVSDGDTILVEPGTYQENIIWPDKRDITLLSSEGPEVTIISGGATERVFLLEDSGGKLDRNTRIEGFTIKDGRTDTSGGGFKLLDTSCVVTNCIIKDCSAIAHSSSGEVYGGGIFISAGAPAITHCVIENNAAQSMGGESAGGGIYIEATQKLTIIQNNVIRNNSANKGGAVYALCPAFIGNNIISENEYDGIVAIAGGTLIVNNTVVGNTRAGIAAIWRPAAILNNITIDNRWGVQGDENSPLVTGWNIPYNNETNYQNVEPGFQDLQESPLLTATYHLTSDSPAIDSGMTSGLDTDIDGQFRPNNNLYDRGADEFYSTTASGEHPTCVVKNERDHTCFRKCLLPGTISFYNKKDAKTKETYTVPDDYPTIQSALDSVPENSTILVKSGVYHENLVWPGGKNLLKLISNSGPDETCIDGSEIGTVIYISEESGSSCSIEGFTIRNGKLSDSSRLGGAGVYVDAHIFTFENCTFENNTVEGNQLPHYYGAALLIDHSGSDVIVKGSIFQNNAFLNNTSGYGAAIAVMGPGCWISNCSIHNNQAGENGGGIYSESPFVVSGSIINNNFPDGVYCLADDAMMFNNTFVDNHFYGFYSRENFPGLLINNIFMGHDIAVFSYPLVTAHNVYWNNSIDLVGLNYGTGDISADPKLDTVFSPMYGSPCIDYGITTGLKKDIYGTDRPYGLAIDVGAIEYTGDLPTPTPSGSPTPTPTEPCTETGVKIAMPSHFYSPGDTCYCIVTVCNTEGTELSNYPLFVILDVYGTLYFAPGFTTEYDNYLDLYSSFPVGKTDVPVLEAFTWPDETGSASDIIWYAALTDPEVTQLFGRMDSWEFGWSD